MLSRSARRSQQDVVARARRAKIEEKARPSQDCKAACIFGVQSLDLFDFLSLYSRRPFVYHTMRSFSISKHGFCSCHLIVAMRARCFRLTRVACRLLPYLKANGAWGKKQASKEGQVCTPVAEKPFAASCRHPLTELAAILKFTPFFFFFSTKQQQHSSTRARNSSLLLEPRSSHFGNFWLEDLTI